MTVLSGLHAPDLPQLGGPKSTSTEVGGEPSSALSLPSSAARLKNAASGLCVFFVAAQSARGCTG